MEAGITLVYGLVGDKVRAVDAIIDGVVHDARMGENGFAVEVVSVQPGDFERFVLRRRDGTSAPSPRDRGG